MVSKRAHSKPATNPNTRVGDAEFSQAFAYLTTEGIFRTVLDEPLALSLSLDDQVAWIFQHSILTEYNQAFGRMNHLVDPVEYQPNPLRNYFQAENPRILAFVEELIRNRFQITDFEINRTSEKGGARWFLMNFYGVIEDERVISGWGTQQEITERKRDERIQAALYKISEATNSTGNVQELLREIHQILGELMPAQNLFIALYDPKAELISFPYYVDEEDSPPGPQAIGHGLTEYVLRTGKPSLVDPAKFDELAQQGEVQRVGTPSIDWLGVPLKVKNNTFGVLAVQTYTEGIRYTEAEKDLLVFVSNQIAMAIDRKQAEDTLRINEARFRAIVEDQTELIVRFLPDTTITFINEAYCRYYGKKRDEILGSSFTAMVTQEDRPSLINRLASLTQTNPSVTVEHRGIKAGGIITWEQWSNRAIFDENGVLVEFQSVGRDITDRKKAEDELRYLSTHDRLTSIYNRAYFEEEMARLDHGRAFPVSLLMADVDGLKETNDTHGHPAGDELLRQTADVLRSAFRTQDVVARIGGDEFGILLPGSDPEIAQRSLERIRASLEDHNSKPGNMLIRLSLGFATAWEPNTLADAFRQADTMMYQEKFQMRARRVQDILKGMKYDV